MANINAIIENLGSGVDGTAKTGIATSLDGIDDSELYEYASPAATTEITRWVKLASITEEILIINEGEVDEADIVISGGTFTGTGFTNFSATVLQGSIEAAKWIQVRFTFDSIDIDTIEWGTDGTGFGELDLAAWSTNMLDYPTITGSERALLDTSTNEAHGVLLGGLTWLTGLSGKENGETHDGIPQLYDRNYNKSFAAPGSSSRLQLAASEWVYSDNQSFEISFWWPNKSTFTNYQVDGLLTSYVFGPFYRYSFYRINNGVGFYCVADTGGSGSYSNKIHNHTGAQIRENSFNTLRVRITGSSFGDVIIILNGVTLTPAATLNSGEDPALWNPYYSFFNAPTNTPLRYFNPDVANKPNGIIIHSARLYSDNNFTTLSGEWLAPNRYVKSGGGTAMNLIILNRVNIPAKNSDSTKDVFDKNITDDINVSGNQRYFNFLSAVGSDDRTFTYAEITGSFELNEPLNFSEGAIFLISKGRNQNRETALGTILEGRDGANDGFALLSNPSNEYRVLYNAQDFDSIGTIPDEPHLVVLWLTDTEIIVRVDGVELGSTTKTGGTISVTSNGKLLEDYNGNKTYEGQIGLCRISNQPLTLSIIQTIESDMMTTYGL